MKNGLMIWNVVLTLVAGYLLFTQFSKGGKNVKSGNTTKDTAQSGFRLAYFEMDSVENNFDMVKEVKADISKKDAEYSLKLSGLDTKFQNRKQYYQDKASTMTQSDYEKAQLDLQQLNESLKFEKQKFDNEYQEFVTRQNLSLKKEIEDFIMKYNENKKYNYIVVYEPGLFYYKDTAYNITADVIKGLNEAYKSKKK